MMLIDVNFAFTLNLLRLYYIAAVYGWPRERLICEIKIIILSWIMYVVYLYT